MGKRIIKFIKYVFECFIHILYEYDEVCVVCSEELFNNEKGLCSKCLSKIKFSENPIYIEKNDICIKCYSISYYSKVITDMIIKLKYKSNFRCGEILAGFMSDFIIKVNMKVDIITFVPMEGKALKKRGYNQSRYLAKVLGDKIEKNVIDCLKKIKSTDDQIGLGKDKRWNNLQNSFKAKENNIFKDKNILLVDDVLTTGATSFYCAYELIKNGAKDVIVLTVAKSRV